MRDFRMTYQAEMFAQWRDTRRWPTALEPLAATA